MTFLLFLVSWRRKTCHYGSYHQKWWQFCFHGIFCLPSVIFFIPLKKKVTAKTANSLGIYMHAHVARHCVSYGGRLSVFAPVTMWWISLVKLWLYWMPSWQGHDKSADVLLVIIMCDSVQVSVFVCESNPRVMHWLDNRCVNNTHKQALQRICGSQWISLCLCSTVL